MRQDGSFCLLSERQEKPFCSLGYTIERIVLFPSLEGEIGENTGAIGEQRLTNRVGVLRRHLSMPGGSEEEAAAFHASVNKLAAAAEAGAPTVFDKIVSKKISASLVYEDDKVLAFRDISPQAPTHVILIPKNRDGLTQLSKAEERHKEILGHLLYTATIVAKTLDLGDGYRIVINDGANGCQSVYHLHLHILGGRQMRWPPG